MTEFEKRGLDGCHTRKYQKHPGIMYKGKLHSWQDLAALPEANAKADNIRAKIVKYEAKMKEKYGEDYQLSDAAIKSRLKMVKEPPPKTEDEETPKERQERLDRELWEHFYSIMPVGSLAHEARYK